MNITHKTSSEGKVYQVTDNGTAYHIETPLKLIKVLEDIRQTRQRVKIYTGDVKTGICSDVYRTDIGTIYIDFALDETNEFLGLSWVTSGNEYIFKMK